MDGEVFHVPNAPPRTTREIIAMISAEVGDPDQGQRRTTTRSADDGLVQPDDPGT